MSTSRLNQLYALLEESPEDTFLLYAIALEHLATGERADAEKYFLKVLDADDCYLPVYYQLALFYQPENKHRAIDFCSKGIALAQKSGKTKTQMELQALLNQLEDE